MSYGYTQDDRLLAIDTPLGKDVLLLSGISGEEGISQLFSFDLRLLSVNSDIAFEEIVGKDVTISITLADGSRRFLSGILSEFGQGHGFEGATARSYLTTYSATMVPWMWLLTRTGTCRIFQNLSVPEIIEQIFSEQGFPNYKLQVNPSCKKREYCTQYRETDFSFISRLLEEEGYYYFFEHEDGRHVLMIVDTNSANPLCPGQKSARMQLVGGYAETEDRITGLHKRKKIRTSKYSSNDFNFKSPDTDLNVSVDTLDILGTKKWERYEFPGLYDNRADGDNRARVYIEEQETRLTDISGSSNCRSFASGYRFRLLDHYQESLNNQEYLLTMVGHNAEQGGYRSGESKSSDSSYSNYFVCIPYEVQYRPAPRTPRPEIHGAQTAIVVGPPNTEIYTNEYGQVKIQFHWDRKGNMNETSSCWIRVAQLWAGNGWGGMFIPRIGQEVVVTFLEGNPDRPLITGTVYNGGKRPPYSLPDNKTMSTIKSNSTTGGGGSNEIRFEDKKGAEEVYIHGQHDMNTVVENDQQLVVHRDRTVNVDQDTTEHIGRNHSCTVVGNREVDITGNDTETIHGSQTLQIGAGQYINVGGTQTVIVDSNQTVTISSSQSVSVVGSAMETVGGSKTITVGGSQTDTVTGSFTLSCGGFTVISGGPINVTSGGPLSITAPAVSLNTPVVTVSGVLQCSSLITSSVVSASYTPGVGNLI